jgi:predicted amidophosphoribosyltransferase
MAEYSWQYTNSKIPLEELVSNIQAWAQSGGYVGKVKNKKNESVLTINKGPGSWQGKVKLSASGDQQMFSIKLDTGTAPFENVVSSLVDVIQHYSGANTYEPPAEPEPLAVPETPDAPIAVNCPTCGNEASFIEQYGKHYCHNCQQYLPEQEAQPEPVVTAEPVQPEPEVQAPAEPEPVAQPTGAICPTCGNEAKYIEQYGRNYCYNCQQYLPDQASEPKPILEPEPEPQKEPEMQPVPSAPQPVAPVQPAAQPQAGTCPTCGNQASFVEQYNRYYCYNCQKYLPEQSVQSEAQPVQPQPSEPVQPQPEPVQPKPMCPTCGGEANFIQQYDRWYCHHCQKYL